MVLLNIDTLITSYFYDIDKLFNYYTITKIMDDDISFYCKKNNNTYISIIYYKQSNSLHINGHVCEFNEYEKRDILRFYLKRFLKINIELCVYEYF